MRSLSLRLIIILTLFPASLLLAQTAASFKSIENVFLLEIPASEIEVSATRADIIPAAATIATPSTDLFYADHSTTITASGPVTCVVLNAYRPATGGTSLGSAPFLVSPAVDLANHVFPPSKDKF